MTNRFWGSEWIVLVSLIRKLVFKEVWLKEIYELAWLIKAWNSN